MSDRGLVKVGDVLQDLFDTPQFAYLAPTKPGDTQAAQLTAPAAPKFPPKLHPCNVMAAAAIAFQAVTTIGALLLSSDALLLFGCASSWVILTTSSMLERYVRRSS